MIEYSLKVIPFVQSKYGAVRLDDLTNRKFEYWTVLGYSGWVNQSHRWVVQCQCGKIMTTTSRRLLNGTSKSCGCRKSHVPYNTTHGLTNSSISSIYHGMIRRCTVPTDCQYKHYGARGISVCDRWINGEDGMYGIQCFLQDMGNRPTPTHTLDRRDNDGNYCPENCRWATVIEQSNNKRTNVVLSYQGETHTLAEWSRLVNIRLDTLWRRVKILKWDTEQALTESTKGTYRKNRNLS